MDDKIMLSDKYKKLKLNIEDIYFSKSLISSKADITRYIQSSKKTLDCKAFITNIINVQVDINQLKASFRKSVRSEINQAIKNHGVTFQIFDKPDFKLIEHFCKYYDKFASNRNLKFANKGKLFRLKENIIISKAFYNEEIVIYHLYIYDDKRIRLLYSCSKQTDNYETVKIISKSNKLLHFEDIKFCKLKNFSIYDFGGISFVNKDVAGIDQFKLGFSKETESSFNFIIANTLKGKLALFLLKITNKI